MGLWDTITDFAHDVTGIPTAKQRREQANMMADQIRAYREQTELTKKEIARKRSEEAAERRRINEKQIRSLRRNYRASSFLGSDQSSDQGMESTLGA